MGYGQYCNSVGRYGGRGDGLLDVKPARKKRKRTVWPEDDVARLWATEGQDEARNPRGNFYFRGNTINSYGGHFPIAILTKKTHNGKRVVLYTNRGYSVTTAGHKATVRYACTKAGFVRCEVPNIDARTTQEHEENYKALLDAYQDALAKANRARENKPWAIRAAEQDRQNLQVYRELFLPRHRSLTVQKPNNLKTEIKAAEQTAEHYKKVAHRRELERQERARQSEFEYRSREVHEALELEYSVA